MSGLIPSRETCATGASNSNYFVRVGNNGDSEIIGDLTVGGTLFVDNIEPISTTEPVYIKAPNEIGGNTVNNNALVVEGGANRIADGSGLQVTIATYKPFTRGTINHVTGEDYGSFASWGKDTSDNDVRYGDIRMVITDPRPTNKQSRINFQVMENNTYTTMLQIDGSQNLVRTLGAATLASDADISANTSIRAATSITAGTRMNAVDISASAAIQAGTTIVAGGAITAGGNITAGATNSVIGRQMTVAETSTMGGLGGIAFTVDNAAAGRVNHDATKMLLTSSLGPTFPLQITCDLSAALTCSKGTGATAGHMNAEFGAVDCSKTVLTIRDKTSQYFVSNSYSILIAQGGGTAFPANGSTNTITPNFSGRYTFEATYLFSVSGDISNSNIVLGFRVSGAGDDYGACLAAGKVVTLPTTDIPAFAYTISSGGHQLEAGTTYTITYIYQGAAGAKGGEPPIGANAGGYVIEAYYG